MERTNVPAADGWVAAVRSAELVGRHVAIARLADTDIALWRDADGRVNAWENRCPHRGMRLSLGSNTGTTLICRYHGWRFDSGTGACSFIPAHPRQIAPKAAAVRTYASAEKYGFVWVGFAKATGQPDIADTVPESPLTFRSLTFHAPLAAVHDALMHETGAVALGATAIRVQLRFYDTELSAVYLVAAQSAFATLVHGFAAEAVPESARLPLLRAQAEHLKTLRKTIVAQDYALTGRA
jgi:nitrite reductase/ring-hydroxylating ferredoxin subunit